MESGKLLHVPVESEEMYEDVIPDTLDLAERCALAVHGITRCVDPELLTMWFNIFYAVDEPHMTHWGSADVGCDTKFGEALPLLRLTCGTNDNMELQDRYFAEMLGRIEGGLYWDKYTPKRPWRNLYAVGHYGTGKDEDFAVIGHNGLMMRAMNVWSQLTDDDKLDKASADLVKGMSRVAVKKADYWYYPEKGGWAEPCTYPKSGWINTEESLSETEGGEGSVTAYHGHQIYGAGQWYERSRDKNALELMEKLSRYVMQPRFWGGVADASRQGGVGHVSGVLPDPAFYNGYGMGHWCSHFHARAIALRGLLMYGRMAQDSAVLEFVKRSWEFTLSQGIARMGWINCYPGALNQVEGCALGDLVGMGIRLSDWGMGDYWDDVDAVVRNQLVQQQLTHPELLMLVAKHGKGKSWGENQALPGQVFYAPDIFTRALGVFGGTATPTSIPNAWVMHCCTGNAARGLYYAWEGTLREEGKTACVNLLLNRAGKLIDIHSYLPNQGKVVIKNKKAEKIRIRIPGWVDRKSLRMKNGDRDIPQDFVGNYLLIDSVKLSDEITITFEVPQSAVKYTINTNSPAEQEYTCAFRGSNLVDISPRDNAPTSYPLYRCDSMKTEDVGMKKVKRFMPKKIIRNW